jgi:hypothetical protein
MERLRQIGSLFQIVLVSLQVKRFQAELHYVGGWNRQPQMGWLVGFHSGADSPRSREPKHPEP